METITVKLKDKEYFTAEHIPQDKDVHFLTGARGRGKSYTVKHLVAECLKRGEQFMYVRVNKMELATCISWLNEMDLKSIFGFDGEVKRGKPYAGALQYCPIHKEDVGYYEPKIIGHVVSLESSALIKSGVYSETSVIVFEEYSRHNLTWKQEVESSVNFIELIETVARLRQVKVYCISNNFKGISPLENIFATADNAVKIRIFAKRAEKEGILQGVQDKYKKYLEGEILENPYVKLTDYEPLICVKYKGQHITLYANIHDRLNDFAFALSKSYVDVALNINTRIWNLEKKVVKFKDHAAEKFVRTDFEEIIELIQQTFRINHQLTIKQLMREKDRKVVR